MKRLHFETTIHAPQQKVWDTLWNEDSYNQWTSSFSPGSKMESDWKEGGRTLFLDAEGNGMISTIKTMNAPREITFEHYGEIIKGVEDTTSERVKSYAGSLETYKLREENGVTMLNVDVDIDEKYEDTMNNGFNNGLKTLKELSEK